MINNLHKVQEVDGMYISKEHHAIYLNGIKICSSAEDYDLIIETLYVYNNNIRYCDSSEPEVQLYIRVRLTSIDKYEFEQDITNTIFLNFKIVQKNNIKSLSITYNDDEYSRTLISKLSLEIFVNRLRKYNCDKKNYYIFTSKYNCAVDKSFLRRIGEIQYM